MADQGLNPGPGGLKKKSWVHITCSKSPWDREMKEKALWHDHAPWGLLFPSLFFFPFSGEYMCPLAIKKNKVSFKIQYRLFLDPSGRNMKSWAFVFKAFQNSMVASIALKIM